VPVPAAAIKTQLLCSDFHKRCSYWTQLRFESWQQDREIELAVITLKSKESLISLYPVNKQQQTRASNSWPSPACDAGAC